MHNISHIVNLYTVHAEIEREKKRERKVEEGENPCSVRMGNLKL
jgi:hypothetical protein